MNVIIVKISIFSINLYSALKSFFQQIRLLPETLKEDYMYVGLNYLFASKEF